jgi:hypothetical protein
VGVVGAAGTAVVAAGVTTPITVPQTSGGLILGDGYSA